MDFRAGRLQDGSRDPSTYSEGSFAPLIRDGDMVVFFEGREPIGFDRMKAKTIWQCRHGAFHHDEIIGKPFGSRVFSRTTKGFLYALSPTPELWSHVVPNRTQIVQDFDQSIVIFRLDLKPGDVVVESGTGSGVMSTAIMRTIAPSGFLHSFEFNEIRASRAQEEFEENALGGLAKVTHRDVCATRADGGGFGKELDGKADAVFLDLPEPWLAVDHAKASLKPGKKLCSYSPCIEQVMKTCEALRLAGFHSVTTIEFRLRNINYAEVQLEVPDFGGSPSTSASTSASASISTPSPAPAPAAKPSEVPSSTASASGATPDRSNGVAAAGAPSSKGGSTEEEKDGSTRKASVKEMEGLSSGGDGNGAIGDVDKPADNVAACGEGSTPRENGSASASAAVSGSHKRPREGVNTGDDAPAESSDGDGDGDGVGEGGAGVPNAGRGRNERLPPKAAVRAAEAAAAQGGAREPLMKLVCAQPFPLMRGHTAFLTFATTPVARELGTAMEAAAGGAVSAEEAKGKGGSMRGGLEGESNRAGVDESGGGAGSGMGGIGGGCEMDAREEGVASAGTGKGREADKPADRADGGAATTAVRDSVDSSSVAER
eukprot:g6111.t1